MEFAACEVTYGIGCAFGDGTDGEGVVDAGVCDVELALRWNVARDVQTNVNRASFRVNGYRSGTS